MDAKKFGAFIAQCRRGKGMTQSDLANQINVTDKAVSRWERGIGFPDINSIEPLAKALGISVLEVMRSEKNECKDSSEKAAVDLMKAAAELAMKNRKQELTATVLAIFTMGLFAALSWIAGFGNPGGSIFFGAIAAVAQTSVYYYMDNREDGTSRKIYAITGGSALAVLCFLVLCVLI